MMGFRALSLLAAAILVGTHAPLLWLWIPICLFGMLVVPWLAVLLANDRPPKRRHRPAERMHRGARPPVQPRPLEPGKSARVIDHDPIDG
jgi:fatty acid desaturase